MSGGPSGSEGPLRVLTLTTLYPNSRFPRHGIFVETRLRELRTRMPVTVRVIAPVPWFPSTWKGFGRYAKLAAVPCAEIRDSIAVWHPRYPMVPKIGMRWQPAAVAWAALRAVGGSAATGGDCDVVDAHYLYPDGVAAMMLAERIDRPFVVTARGSDVNLIGQLPGPRKAILRMAHAAAKVITVSEALKRSLVSLGVDESCIEVLRNGVDMSLFSPVAQKAARADLGIEDGPLIVSVGNLVAEKGYDLVVAALAHLPGVNLVVVGEGPLRPALEDLARRLRVGQRVRFLPNMPQARLRSIYSAADLLAVGSRREGWPNVVLEAMACGTPVVATNVGGVPEIIADAAVGEVVNSRDPAIFAVAASRVLARAPNRDQVRTIASGFDWESVVCRYHELLASAARLEPQNVPSDWKLPQGAPDRGWSGKAE
jgi:glycosyltransferase involved in cell wall biosynthesis